MIQSDSSCQIHQCYKQHVGYFMWGVGIPVVFCRQKKKNMENWAGLWQRPCSHIETPPCAIPKRVQNMWDIPNDFAGSYLQIPITHLIWIPVSLLSQGGAELPCVINFACPKANSSAFSREPRQHQTLPAT